MKVLPYLLVFASTSAFSAEYIVKLKSGASLKSLKNSSQIQREFTVPQGQFAVIEASENEAAFLLNAHSEIEYIEPNYTYHAFDADYDKQWGLSNTGKNSGSWLFPGKKGMDINAEKAWGVTKGDRKIKIAVIDTGVDYNHEDLKENIMINEAELNGVAGVDDDGNGYVDDVYGMDFANNDSDPMDGHGHGTHCAGVIGASHNSIGVRGVMANVEILPIQFLAANGSGSLEGAVKAINYAVSRGVNIMSNSWGGGGESQALEEAIKLAEDAGILFVAAAGNSNANNDVKPSVPATIALDNILSVGAMDGKGKKAKFSNYGAKSVHVFAPGVDIYSTVQGNKYKKMSGTSMACPFVSGVAGLIWANEPSLSVHDLKKKIMSTTRDEAKELTKYSVAGLVDAFAALTK